MSIGGVFIAALTLIYSIYKDSTRRASENGKTSVILADIKTDIGDLRDAQKRQEGKQEAYLERLARVEESAKSAHHRIDGLEIKINGGKII